MTLLALGINHKTASVALREKVAFSPEKIVDAHKQVLRSGCVDEAVIVSTCNRTEVYCQIKDGSEASLVQWFSDYHQVSAAELTPCLYLHQGEDAVSHLMRVSCGLDSLVLGEPQILGQIKQAFTYAREAGSAYRTLDRLFQNSFSVAKHVRTVTEIGASAVSVAYAAVKLSKQIFTDLSETQVLLIGAGETVELAAKHLADQGVKKMIVANRTLERAEKVAAEYNAFAITLSEIPGYLHMADMVISSTASPLPILGKGAVETALKQRKHQPMLLVDIAVPRDIEEEVGELNDVYLYTVDDLEGIIQQNMAARQEAAIEAEKIVENRRDQFMEWLESLKAVDSIRQYRNTSEILRDELVEKALVSLQQGNSAENVIKELGFKLTNKLIHTPTQALNLAGRQGQQEKLDTIRFALGLEQKK